MIICDLDGVFADFTTAACVVHGRPEFVVCRWNFFEQWDMTEEEFWEPIHALGDEFYGEIVQPFPWAERLLSAVRQSDDFLFLSAPTHDASSYSGKRIWLDKYLEPGLELMVGARKELVAGRDRLLLDDNDGNVRRFQLAGGVGVVFPQPWNSYYMHVETRMAETEFLLNSWQRPQIQKTLKESICNG